MAQNKLSLRNQDAAWRWYASGLPGHHRGFEDSLARYGSKSFFDGEIPGWPKIDASKSKKR